MDCAVACFRLTFRYLMVAMVALGLASAPLYAAASAVTMHHHEHLTNVAQGAGDSHAIPAKSRAVGQPCCHPGCIMAVVPGFASLAAVLLPWVTVPIPREPGVASIAPLGPDRPPKRA
jgi:hypothetical protein